MKKILTLAVSALLLTACNSNDDETTTTAASEPVKVTLSFTGYEMAPMSKATTSVASVVTKLDVWIYENGSEVEAFHQSSTDDGFGTVAVTLNKTKTYTLYAVGHRASGAATLADGVIAFPDDKVTHSMYYTTTFTPSETTSLSCEMNRIVALFAFATTDQLPAECTKMTLTIAGVYDRWNVSTGATHSLDRTSTFNSLSALNDGTIAFNIYAITTGAQTLHDVTVTAYNSSDEVVQTRTFEDVPLRNGYKTTYKGTFFTDTPTTAAFTVGDWSEYDEVEF